MAPLRTGQKTGLVLYDQTWRTVSAWLRYMWPGMRVLDVCSYVGAWAVTASSRTARLPRRGASILREGALQAAQPQCTGHCGVTAIETTR